jgi:thiamine phosphate synthase YjbQ (UPF0047 family)
MLLTESRQLKDPKERLYIVMSECFTYKSQAETLTPDSAEGPDDMPAHIKSALIGASVTIPIKDGKLVSASLSLSRP